ncbi:hypothetical protein [Flavobacterium gilvum]
MEKGNKTAGTRARKSTLEESKKIKASRITQNPAENNFSEVFF